MESLLTAMYVCWKVISRVIARQWGPGEGRAEAGEGEVEGVAQLHGVQQAPDVRHHQHRHRASWRTETRES